MNESEKRGINFGLTSGVITTLGLIYGLQSSIGSKAAILGGIMTIAIADSLSDAMGMHISAESAGEKHNEVGITTRSTFLAKFFVALSFLIPFTFLNIIPALIVGTIWGLTIIIYSNLQIAKKLKKKPLRFILEHLVLTILVMVLAHFAGLIVAYLF